MANRHPDPDGLARYRHRRTAEAELALADAVRRLRRGGGPVTLAALAREMHLSRSTLYRNAVPHAAASRATRPPAPPD